MNLKPKYLMAPEDGVSSPSPAASPASPEPAATPDPQKPAADDKDAIIKALRSENASTRKKLRAIEEDRKKAAEAALAEKGEFKTLAEQRAKELEEARAKLSTYEQRESDERARKEAQVASEFDKLPESVRSRIPEDADLRAKEIAVATFQAAQGSAPSPRPSTANAPPRPSSGATPRTFAESELAGIYDAARRESPEAFRRVSAEIQAAYAEGRITS